MSKKCASLSRLYIYHYLKLGFRILLFVFALVYYIASKINDTSLPFGEHPIFWGGVWLFFFFGMVLRIFPSKLETIGCQKQLKRNYVPTGEEKPSLTSWKATFSLTVCWIALNLVFGILYLTDVFDAGILILISLAYGVCDIVCILFFCPIRDWFLKNKCCADCRIYNWDYAMMFTPFLLIPRFYTWSLLGLALLLLIRWEITLKRHPERFAEKTNCSLSCANCEEKLCQHKKQLRQFIRKNAARLVREIEGK